MDIVEPAKQFKLCDQIFVSATKLDMHMCVRMYVATHTVYNFDFRIFTFLRYVTLDFRFSMLRDLVI